MEVAKISPSSVRVKTKLGTLAVNPLNQKTKVVADGVLLLDRNIKNSEVNVEPTAVIFSGPGEYETKGVKITGLGKAESVAYTSRMEGMDVFIAKVSALAHKDLVQDSQVVILDADVPAVEQSAIASFNANVFVFFGENAAALATSLGKQATPVTKYTITRDKLPAELEVVVL